MIQLFLLDDHELTRTGFRFILGREKDIEVVGDCGSGEEALVQVRRLRPHVLLCDLYLPGVSGLEVTERVVQMQVGTRVIALSAQPEGPLPRRLMEAGAYGYLGKGCTPGEMLRAIRTVAQGQRFLGGSVAQHLALDSLTNAGASPFDQLSTRELETVLLLMQGLRVYEIAERLRLSDKTVSSHKYNALDKLGVRDLSSLTRLAMQWRVVDPVSV
jgi:DNA-binding NarL/FixJ family response regulator